MRTCAVCGKEVDDAAEFCPFCGIKMNSGSTQNYQYSQFNQNDSQNNQYNQNSSNDSQNNQYNQNSQNDSQNNQYNQYNEYHSTNQNDVTGNFDPRDINDNKVMGVLAYIGILVLIPLLAAPKNSEFSKFHANQGLVLFIAEVIIGIVTYAIPFIGILDIVTFVFSVMGIVYAATGRAVKLPLIGDIKIIK